MVWENLRSSSALELGLRQLELYAVDAVHAVHEQDEDEDERDLHAVSKMTVGQEQLLLLTFNPYCNFAIIGFSEMKVNRPRFTLNGNGMMSAMNTTISKTRRAKTCDVAR